MGADLSFNDNKPNNSESAAKSDAHEPPVKTTEIRVTSPGSNTINDHQSNQSSAENNTLSRELEGLVSSRKLIWMKVILYTMLLVPFFYHPEIRYCMDWIVAGKQLGYVDRVLLNEPGHTKQSDSVIEDSEILMISRAPE